MADDTQDTTDDAPSQAPLTPSVLDPFERMGLDDWFGRLPGWFGARLPERLTGEPLGMRLEEIREDGQLVIRGEIPGVDPDKDIEISVDNGRLTIEATREQRTEAQRQASVGLELRDPRHRLDVGGVDEEDEASGRRIQSIFW